MTEWTHSVTSNLFCKVFFCNLQSIEIGSLLESNSESEVYLLLLRWFLNFFEPLNSKDPETIFGSDFVTENFLLS